MVCVSLRVHRRGFPTSDRAEEQGVGRRKNAAYMGVCLQCQGALPLTLTEMGHNTAIWC
jgi:hypothetical protein